MVLQEQPWGCQMEDRQLIRRLEGLPVVFLILVTRPNRKHLWLYRDPHRSFELIDSEKQISMQLIFEHGCSTLKLCLILKYSAQLSVMGNKC